MEVLTEVLISVIGVNSLLQSTETQKPVKLIKALQAYLFVVLVNVFYQTVIAYSKPSKAF